MCGNDSASFDALLDRLARGREEAARQYEALRRRLIKFFEWEQCREAEDLADDCLDRVARKIEEGVEILNVASYAAGIARMQVKEYHTRRQKEAAALQEFTRSPRSDGDGDSAAALDDLEQCLDQLRPEQRDLVLGYYAGEQSVRIRNRQRIAAQLGMTVNALRNRAMRLREILETCMASRGLDRDTSAKKSTKTRGARL
jgi:RNA polymerase sigma factor (sigma-70 family)